MRLEYILVIVCTHPYKMTSIVMSHDIRGIRLCLWCISTGFRVMRQTQDKSTRCGSIK